MSDEDSGMGGWLFMIVALIVVNLLSWAFNWGFWLY